LRIETLGALSQFGAEGHEADETVVTLTAPIYSSKSTVVRFGSFADLSRRNRHVGFTLRHLLLGAPIPCSLRSSWPRENRQPYRLRFPGDFTEFLGETR
jgi:hypothetical protein